MGISYIIDTISNKMQKIKCKMQSAKCKMSGLRRDYKCLQNKNPPSDEGGGKIFDFDGGRELPIIIL